MNTTMMVAVLSVAVVTALGVMSAVVRARHRAAADGVPGQSVRADGVRGPRPPQGRVSAAEEAELLSNFEVSRAIGVSVEGTPVPGRREIAYHSVHGGERLLQASVLPGRAGRAALRAYGRRGRPLSHAGDLAYKGDDWVLGRRGDVVVLLCQFGSASWRVSGGLPWLLSTALDRVPRSAARLNRA